MISNLGPSHFSFADEVKCRRVILGLAMPGAICVPLKHNSAYLFAIGKSVIFQADQYACKSYFTALKLMRF